MNSLFRETALLFDPDHGSERSREYVAILVTHEVSFLSCQIIISSSGCPSMVWQFGVSGLVGPALAQGGLRYLGVLPRHRPYLPPPQHLGPVPYRRTPLSAAPGLP